MVPCHYTLTIALFLFLQRFVFGVVSPKILVLNPEARWTHGLHNL